MSKRILTVLALSLVACGAGPYGHSRVYSPLGPEEDAAKGAQDYDPVMSKRQPEEWAKKKVSVFGIVVKRDEGEKGVINLVVSVRILENRNLCEEQSEDTCRTTVSDHEFDRMRVTVRNATPEDEAGEHSIGVGSLIRAIGKVQVGEGGLVLDASYYRHWPRGFFVTTASAGLMRR